MDQVRTGTATLPAELASASVLQRLALGLALLVTLLLPAGYFSVSYRDLVEHGSVSAQVKAAAVNRLVTANPELWAFQLQRMEELLLQLPAPLLDDRATIRDRSGDVILAVGSVPAAPVLVSWSPIFDSGRVVGRVESAHSYRGILLGTGAAAVLGLLLGALVYATLRVLPMRALRRAIVERDADRQIMRSNEENYRVLFDANPHPMWVFDEDTLAFLAVNNVAVEKYGWSRDEFLKMSLEQIRPPEDVPAMREFVARTRSARSRRVHASRHRSKSGALFDVEISSHPVEFGGRPARLATAYDVTERKRAEAALRAAEEQYRGLVEQSIAGIYIIQDGAFVYVNPRFAELRGFAGAEDLVGVDPLSLVAEPDRGAVAERNRGLLAGGAQTVDYVFTAIRKDGSTFEAGVHSAYATYRGRPAIIGMMQDISEKQRAEQQIKSYIAQLEGAIMQTVEVATALSEMRDPYTAGHERRVAEIAVAIGTELGLDALRCEGLRIAGFLHDIGKISVPAEILAKPTRLTGPEMQLVRGHPQSGYEVLKGVNFPWPVAQAVLQHHERLDGTGYPQGLKGDAITLEARILAVADVIEAMSSHRPYRAGLGIEKALAEVERGRSTAYDSTVADAALRLFREKKFSLAA